MKAKRLWWTIRTALTRGGRRIPVYSELISFYDNVAIARNVDFCTHDVMHVVLNRMGRTTAHAVDMTTVHDMSRDVDKITPPEILGGDCPKTQKSILKVEDTTQDTTIEKQEMVSENDFVVHSDIKVENEDRSKLVFGQPGGGVFYSSIKTIGLMNVLAALRLWIMCSLDRIQSSCTTQGSAPTWSSPPGVW